MVANHSLHKSEHDLHAIGSFYLTEAAIPPFVTPLVRLTMLLSSCSDICFLFRLLSGLKTSKSNIMQNLLDGY
jgi:hypothetical protein